MRVIDADALMEAFYEKCPGDCGICMAADDYDPSVPCGLIKEAPTIEAMYNGIAIFRNDREPIDHADDRGFYECDPKKNTECRKTGCYINGGECSHTTHKEYRRGAQS
jgi:hypothetical protein